MASTYLNRLSRPCQRPLFNRQICNHRQLRVCPRLLNFSSSTHLHHAASTARHSLPWHERYLPTILRPSFWRSMIPKPLRKDARMKRQEVTRDQRWNPATYFIVIFLLIGSFSIHFINLRQSYAISSRQAENRIATLQEVLRRVKAGENVDVEKMLGTGDPLAEQEWEEVVKKIEEEDRLWKSKERRDARKKARKEAREAAAAAQAAENSPTSSDQFSKTTTEFVNGGEFAPKKKRSPGFY